MIEFDSPDTNARDEMNQGIATFSNFFDGNVPARDSIVDNWDALTKDAFTDDAVKNNAHKRMKRNTLTRWSRYVHAGLHPKPDPSTVIRDAGIAVVVMLHRFAITILHG